MKPLYTSNHIDPPENVQATNDTRENIDLQKYARKKIREKIGEEYR